MTPVEMPKANENLVEATLDRWIVKEGDRVAKDQSLCDIITDKAKFELPSPAEGIVQKILASERSILPVGYVLCVLGESIQPDHEYISRVESANATLATSHRAASAMPSSAAVKPSPGTGAVQTAVQGPGVRATPAARRLAREAGVDLALVAQSLALSGPVNEKDIRYYLDTKK